MKKIVLFSIFIFLIAKMLIAQVDNTKYNSMGKYFLVALTPNDNQVNQMNANSFIITGKENTEITITNPRGQVFKIQYQKNKILKIDEESNPGIILTKDEIWESETFQNKVFKITSNTDISLQVVMKKGLSSESYLAMPVATWGKNYIHNSYWELKEAGQWASGFIIIASEDNTKVSIEYNGKGNTQGSTKEGKKIGDKENITMTKGQTYLVMGDGNSSGVFDFSGTNILGSKPIGVISFHNRTLIPSFEVKSSRSHLVEFMLPTNLWGKNFTTLELNRETNKGDYFRVIALEDNTSLEVTTYMFGSLEIAAKETLNLTKNRFYEFDSIVAKMPHNNISKNMINTWKSDKPIMLVQYSYSSDFDGNIKYKPFMTLVPPEELYTKESYFTTDYSYSNDSKYNENYVHLTIIGSEYVATNQIILESIFINNNRLIDLISPSSFIKIPNSKINIVRIPLVQGQYSIKGDAAFGGIIYGKNDFFNNYGNPAIISFGESSLVNSIDNAEISNDIDIYPNPANEIIKIKLNLTDTKDFKIINYKILDNLGNDVNLKEKMDINLNLTNSEFKIDIKELSSAKYYIVFETIEGKKLYNSFVISK